MKHRALPFAVLAILFAIIFIGCQKKTTEPDEMVATPTFNPESGMYATAQTVTISCATEGATIRYTTDSSEPTRTSSMYTSPLSIASTTTIKAKGFLEGWRDSATASACYTITDSVAAPFFEPPGGTFTSPQSVVIKCPTDGAIIRFTINGSEPTEESLQYTTPLNFRSSNTVKAKGFKEGWIPSATASSSYIIEQNVANPEISPQGGSFSGAQNVAITCVTGGTTIRYTTDGSEPAENSAIYTSPLYVYKTTTIKAKGFKSGWMPSASVSESYTINYTPIPMVAVSGGSFNMGDTHMNYYQDELPVHQVTVGSFNIGKYEITQAEYKSIMCSNPASVYGVSDDRPVYYVNWYAAIKYCNLRSMAEGLAPVYSISGSTDPADWGPVPDSDNAVWNSVVCLWNSCGYRLPTEAEWEYAARGAANLPDYLYSGADNINQVAWYARNNTNLGYPSGVKPIGIKAQNGIGTHDMSGNVGEWCWDWYGYYDSGGQTDPKGPSNGTYRVVRNSGWNSMPCDCRVSERYGSEPHYKNYSRGFRLCRSIP